MVTAGQKGDAPQAAPLIEGLPADIVMADTAYDSDRLRDAIAEKGAVTVIPNNPSRARKHPLDKHLYAQRHLIECCFSKLKQFRRIATRYEKTALDAETETRLVDILNSPPQAMVIVSHDRAFLAKVANRWVRLESGTLREAASA